MSGEIPFDNTYGTLPERFFTRQPPAPVAQPSMISVNRDLASELGINADWLASDAGLSVLAGNSVPEGADPLAQVYAGHQFGGWSPQLGDGRAVLLGEVVDRAGQRRDIQLKGAGRTPYSRGGDGRAWLGPVLREYIVSEAMHALGIPTTRALAAVQTGEPVLRETSLPGAVLTRVAASHIRVGTFQYFAARQDAEALGLLYEHVVARHYPQAGSPLELLDCVIAAQAELIARWMSVGFIHGVMNTDNMTISGETIDYGPCAFMDSYDPDMVFSSIDQFGRYAYSKQPEIAVWNLAQFASCLLPLMGESKAAITQATAAVHRFPQIYQDARDAIFRRKIGLSNPRPGDEALVQRFLDGLTNSGADFTNAFRGLSVDNIPDGLEDWGKDWRTRRDLETDDPYKTMTRTNPAFIPRNHRIEAAISSAVEGDLAPFYTLNSVLARPYQDQPNHDAFSASPTPGEVVKQTFCGT
ncbi:MAG: YdiU family protein [Marinosulfonomonas sp.]|nr:YdiU family protein [Marinosulfonomonas sp.]